MSKKLYIGNLAYEVREEDLAKSFGEVGDCISTRIIRDQYSNTSRGFGFVEMATDEEAEEAMAKLNGLEIHGRKIVVQEARPRREGGQAPHGGRSGGFGRRERY
jgi:RNA recognition motif-containing protein